MKLTAQNLLQVKNIPIVKCEKDSILYHASLSPRTWIEVNLQDLSKAKTDESVAVFALPIQNYDDHEQDNGFFLTIDKLKDDTYTVKGYYSTPFVDSQEYKEVKIVRNYANAKLYALKWLAEMFTVDNSVMNAYYRNIYKRKA